MAQGCGADLREGGVVSDDVMADPRVARLLDVASEVLEVIEGSLDVERVYVRELRDALDAFDANPDLGPAD